MAAQVRSCVQLSGSQHGTHLSLLRSHRRQATFAPAKTSVTDIALALSVFVVAFGAGTFLNSR